MKRGKFLEILNSKPVIGALIFVMLSLVSVFASDLIFESGDLNVTKNLLVEGNLTITGDVVCTDCVGNADLAANSVDLTSDALSTTYAGSGLGGGGTAALFVDNGELTSDVFGTTTSGGTYEFEDGSVCIGLSGCTADATDGRLLVEGTIAVGVATHFPFNHFGDGILKDSATIASTNDVFISGDLEVEGVFTLTGGSTAIVNNDIAEVLLTEQGRKNVLCEGDPNCVVGSYARELEFGDLVCINPYTANVIMKCSQTNSRLAVGFVSNTSRINMGNNLEYGYPIAVAGIVFSKVTTENGDINPGDLLVSSSKPGYAMKNNDPKPGVVVAKAFDFCYEDECNILSFVALS